MRGRDIGKYEIKSSELYIINAHNGNIKEGIKAIDIKKDYPKIYQYFIQFKDKMKIRPSKGKHWTNTPANFSIEYSKPKIIWGELSDKAKFTFDDTGIYVEATVFLMTGENLKYILSIFNSKLAQWYFEQIATSSGMGTNRWKKYKIEQFPIKDIKNVNPFEILVDYLLHLYNKENPAILSHTDNARIASHLEDILNMMVYELYFEEHMKEVDLDVLQFVTPIIENLQNLPIEQQIKELYEWYQKPENAVRQRLMLIDTRSPDILAVIHKSV